MNNRYSSPVRCRTQRDRIEVACKQHDKKQMKQRRVPIASMHLLDGPSVHISVARDNRHRPPQTRSVALSTTRQPNSHFTRRPKSSPVHNPSCSRLLFDCFFSQSPANFPSTLPHPLHHYHHHHQLLRFRLRPPQLWRTTNMM